MTSDELFHDPLFAHSPVFREEFIEETTEAPKRPTSAPRKTVDQRSLELQRVQDELKKMARASKHV